jgi:hypothetical protein
MDIGKPCDDGFPSIFKVMMLIYSLFILKSIVQIVFISFNSDMNLQKLSLNSMNYITHM